MSSPLSDFIDENIPKQEVLKPQNFLLASQSVVYETFGYLPEHLADKLKATADARKKFIRSLCIRFDLDQKFLKDDTRFIEDLGANKVELIQIALDIEAEFGLYIPEEEMKELRTIGSTFDYILRHQR